MAEERDLKSYTVDGVTETYLTPEEQAAEDRRQVEKTALKKKSFKNFFRMFKITTADRP